MANSTEADQNNGVGRKLPQYRRQFIYPNLWRVHVPRMPYQVFDPAGNLLPMNLLNLLDCGYTNSFWYHGNGVNFMLKGHVKIDTSFYNVSAPIDDLILEYTNTFVKQSSRGMTTTLYHRNMTSPYVIQNNIGVNVDPVTRRPKPFPAWWRTLYKFPTSNGKQTQTQEEPQTPEDRKCMENECTVQLEDIDVNNHANHSVYVRFAYESWRKNLLAGRTYYGSNSVTAGRLSDIKVTFKQECLLGDVVTVTSWRDELCKHAYHFHLRKGNALVAIVTLVFYDDVNGDSNVKSRATAASKL